MQINQRKKRIEIIIGILFLWICISVIIAYNNLNKIQKDNERLENAINQFQNLEKLHADLNNLIDDSLILNNKKVGLPIFQNHINQLSADTAELKKTLTDNKLKAQLDSIKYKINETKISTDFVYKNETERNNVFSTFKEIKNYVKKIKKNQLKVIDQAEQVQYKNAKNKNKQLLIFRVTFFIVIIILILLLKNNLTLFEKKAKKEIEEKNTRLKNIIDGFFDPFFSLDNEWNITYMNDAAASHYNLSKMDLIGKNYWEVTPHLREHQFYTELTSAKINAKPSVVELCYAPTQQWYENWIYPNDYGISVYYREITEKKKEEERLLLEKNEQKQINDRLLLIAGATNEALWDWDMVKNIVWGNENYYELLGEKEENESNYDAFVKKMHPDDVEKSFALYEEAMKNKSEILINEYRFLNKNGEWINLLNRQKYIYDEEGKPIRILGTLLDITFQKKIQEKLEHEISLSEGLINSLPGLFYMFNKNGEYVRWNKNLEIISGYTNGEIENSDVGPLDFIHNDQKNIVGDKIKNILATGISDNVEADFLTKENKRIPYYFTGVYLKYNNEDCMMGVGLDISEKVRVEKELRDYSSRIQNIREEERTNIAREIHDELGQQLTGLKMNLSWISKKLSNNVTPDLSDKISDSLRTIDDTIQSVRKISTELRPSILDDLGLIAALEWQTEEFQKRFNINTSFFSNVSFLEINRDKATAIFRIYQESLTNVLRHSKATQLNTVFDYSDKELKLKIVDNGIGFDIHKVKEKNTLGILGIKERANLIGGSCEIASELNKGTTITIIMTPDA